MTPNPGNIGQSVTLSARLTYNYKSQIKPVASKTLHFVLKDPVSGFEQVFTGVNGVQTGLDGVASVTATIDPRIGVGLKTVSVTFNGFSGDVFNFPWYNQVTGSGQGTVQSSTSLSVDNLRALPGDYVTISSLLKQDAVNGLPIGGQTVHYFINGAVNPVNAVTNASGVSSVVYQVPPNTTQFKKIPIQAVFDGVTNIFGTSGNGSIQISPGGIIDQLLGHVPSGASNAQPSNTTEYGNVFFEMTFGEAITGTAADNGTTVLEPGWWHAVPLFFLGIKF
jgi:hypothetical protein